MRYIDLADASEVLGLDQEILLKMRDQGKMEALPEGAGWKVPVGEVRRLAKELAEPSELPPSSSIGEMEISLQEQVATALDRITPTDLEDLTCYILYREGFYNIEWHGEAGSDKGRDIVCKRDEIFGNRASTRNCVVQCKRYKGSVPRSTLMEDLAKATEFHPGVFLLVVSGTLNSNTKDWLAQQDKRHGFEIVLWERFDLQTILERHHDLLFSFLNISTANESIVDQLLEKGALLTRTEQGFFKSLHPTVRQCMRRASELSLEHNSALTIGHVFATLTEGDGESMRPALEMLGHDPDSLAETIRSHWMEKQQFFPVKERGIQGSASLRMALETASRISFYHAEFSISPRRLIQGLIAQKNSKSLRFLQLHCGIDLQALLKVVESHPNDQQSRRGAAGQQDDIDEFLLADPDLIMADDDDFVLTINDDDLGLENDSGINLMAPSESGLTLESEPLELAGSNLDLEDDSEADSFELHDSDVVLDSDLVIAKVHRAVDQLELKPRTKNLLKESGITEIRDLARYLSLAELTQVKGVGGKTLQEIEASFKAWLEDS